MRMRIINIFRIINVIASTEINVDKVEDNNESLFRLSRFLSLPMSIVTIYRDRETATP